MSFWKSLFGGATESAPVAGDPESYKGFVIRAAPFPNGGQFQTAGSIEKTFGGETKRHDFVRADAHASRDEAITFSLAKARQIVDLQGDRLFE